MSMTKTAISKKIILITGASSDFGRLTAEALARAGHTAYASVRDGGRKASNAAEMAEISAHDGLEVRPAISTSSRSRRPMPRSRRSSARAAGRRRGP
jgi:NAD(P)-dependent dehydrogenase (short-subunit alcohol dehydrogenase family)